MRSSTLEDILPEIFEKFEDKNSDVIRRIIEIYFEELKEQINHPQKYEIATLWGTLRLNTKIINSLQQDKRKERKGKSFLEELDNLTKLLENTPVIKSEKSVKRRLSQVEYLEDKPKYNPERFESFKKDMLNQKKFYKDESQDDTE